ncbi:ATPase, histidine kinase-, DNA gyrase B-, and HSP90-like domain protein [Synechococcus sp. PCC 7335]|uniref:hybrid sensor histidine kinase/response regulator n=1 Tax=Synechococcus sp. (strain ATCC 29403 / PCC 7335) TaxID=91464 RepID=UPI00017EE7E9|nr:hybrid sensor histidine kinase/response regulator [Synechococcus sp. PCC 7335]EDX85665.1 ATPase, histidine kinase-, DNA gyrase B-, and HSP90-like domain protein [Synechococcus sp. PCC 7335]
MTPKAIHSQPHHTQPGQSGFAARIARSFLLLALIAVGMVGTVAYVRGRRALEEAAYNRLSVTATLKEKEITRWLVACEEDFLLIASFPTVETELQTLLTNPAESAAYQRAYQRLSAYLEEIQNQKPKFTDISIQNRANQIVLSTNPELEGKYEISTNLTEVEEVEAGETFAPIFYVSPKTGKPAITYATKVLDTEGNRQGMILANLNLKRIDDIISERTGLSDTGETYLVGLLANKTAFISREGTDNPLAQSPQSEGIAAAFERQNGEGLYDNYLGKPVIGVYRWLSGQDLALLAEMSQQEAFLPARRLAITLTIVGLGSAAILLLGVNRLVRQLSRSRLQIESYSQQLEKTALAANTANKAKSEFLANMSHELRTPLNAILGFTQLMQSDHANTTYFQKERSSDYNNYLGIISRSGGHLLTLINDVLSMSKIEAGRLTLDPTCFDLRYLLRTLEEMLSMRAEAKAITLSVQVDQAVPQFVKTDEAKLRQVLVNLVGNAIKFTPTGSVTLSVSCENIPSLYRLNFSIVDTGVGISAEDLSCLFDPFFQASRTRTAHQGTGLGLAISQRFVQMMGGEINVESIVDQGSTFSFSIQAQPAELDELPTAPIGTVVSLAPGQRTYRILVVEDVDSARSLMLALLSPIGFEVQAVTNGEEAIAAFKSWCPDLIWMDMRMPIMDGYEATKQIRAIAANQDISTKIIAVTASAFEEERAQALACGCDDLVRKPFDTQTIFEKMTEQLGVQYLYSYDLARYSSSSDIPTLPQNLSAPSLAAHEPNDQSASFSRPAKPLQPEDMTVMPAAWRAKFQKAAIAVDAEQLYQLISQIPESNDQLAASLTQMTQNFCFDELIELT